MISGRLAAREDALVEEIARRRDDLVDLASRLIAFDTTARFADDDPARDEAPLQAELARRLATAGFDVDLWEPGAEVEGMPLVPPGYGFAGRPQLIARLRGDRPGRTLVLNGHIDCVTVEPRQRWSGDPFGATVRDGMLTGRGACDMKGGIAAAVIAAEVVAQAGLRCGELIVATNTDEESTGAGACALLARGLRADGCVVVESTGFHPWIASRGAEFCEIEVEGRPGHLEGPRIAWEAGGSVNAIERTPFVLDALSALRREWSERDDLRHPVLPRPTVSVTRIEGGEWIVSEPARCTLTASVLYLPGQDEPEQRVRDVRAEVESAIEQGAAHDPWLGAHPPVIRWLPDAAMPLETDPNHPLVTTAVGACADLGLPSCATGGSWFDGATLSTLGGIPTVALGPTGVDSAGSWIAHTVDEYCSVDDLVSTAQALAVLALRYCGGR